MKKALNLLSIIIFAGCSLYAISDHVQSINTLVSLLLVSLFSILIYFNTLKK